MSDIVKDSTLYRIKQIELAEAEYYKSLIKTLDRIEREVVSLVSKLPLTDGKLIELQSAIPIRPQIKAILEREYLAWSDTVVRQGFNKQAKRIEKTFKRIGNIPLAFQEITKGDLALIQNLKQQYFTQFKDVANTFTRRLAEKVYTNTLLGSEFTVLEKELIKICESWNAWDNHNRGKLQKYYRPLINEYKKQIKQYYNLRKFAIKFRGNKK